MLKLSFHLRHCCLFFSFWLLGSLALEGQVPFSSDTIVTPSTGTVHAGDTMQFSVLRNGVPRTDGYWYSNGIGNVGGVNDASGLYSAPLFAPSNPVVVVGYYMGPTRAEAMLTITNPRPKPDYINITSFTQMSTPIAIHGHSFLPNTVIYVQGRPMPTNYLGEDWISTQAVLASPVSGNVLITVTNPDPGTSSTTINVPAVFPAIQSISPAKLMGGWVTLKLTGGGYTSNTVAMMDGRPLKTTINSATALTAYGYLPPWKTASTTTISVIPEPGSSNSASKALPITKPILSYDIAARFTTQAAFGPRPGLVEHIQQVGLKGYIAEQVKLPGVSYVYPTLPRYPFLQAVAVGDSLLRLRVATALQSFIVNQGNTEEFKSYSPWETKLEADALGNFRQLMTDIVSDARLTGFLNLPGNSISMDGTSHPNQNFSREFIQLFTLGTSMLNDDGTIQHDSNGVIIPSYDQTTIIDLSRAFTGWNYGPLLNSQYTAFGIDFSQPLAAFDQNHDHGAKILFGTVQLPAGQSIVADRAAALDAVFNHPNLPPFITSRLIGQLITSNPSPDYVRRVSVVFKDNGKGVRGDLAATITAILLDPEARAGDTATQVRANDGFLQDPLLFEAFLMNVLQQTTWDGQPTYLPGKLGQDFWHPNSVFGFYPQAYLIPGTLTNSPQFSLFNNLTQLHRSQYLYGIIAGTTSGFMNLYQQNSWLYTAFTNVPDLVDALNHQLFHGNMPIATQSEILNYCAGVPDKTQAFNAAIFLAINSDSYNVAH